MAARSTRGDQACTECRDRHTVGTPAAAAERNIDPTLPGSWMSSSQMLGPASVAGCACRGVGTTPMIPVGVATEDSCRNKASA
jgi:hypothetical protein